MKAQYPTTKTKKPLKNYVLAAVAVGFFIGAGLAAVAEAQPPAPAAIGPSPARQAIEVRKATFTLIANSFKPIGDTLQGKIPYDANEIQKRAARVAFLSELIGEQFPDASNTGLPDTKARSEIWTDRVGFDKKVKEFREHAATLAQVAAKENSASDAFKTAAAAVGQDCKGCHEQYKVK